MFRVSGVVKLSKGPHQEGRCGLRIFAGPFNGYHFCGGLPPNKVDHHPAQPVRDENGHHRVGAENPTVAAEKPHLKWLGGATNVFFLEGAETKKDLIKTELSTVRRVGRLPDARPKGQEHTVRDPGTTAAVPE